MPSPLQVIPPIKHDPLVTVNRKLTGAIRPGAAQPLKLRPLDANEQFLLDEEGRGSRVHHLDKRFLARP